VDAQFWLMIILAVAAIASAVFAGFQAGFGRSMARLVQRQFDLAHRPYLYVENVSSQIEDRKRMTCIVHVNNCGDSPAEEVSIKAVSASAGVEEHPLVEQSGLTVFPRQTLAVSWTIDGELDRLLTGYEKHEVSLRIAYRESLTKKLRRFRSQLRFDQDARSYVVVSSHEDETGADAAKEGKN